MLSKNTKLNQKVFDADVEKKPVRKGFGMALLEDARADEKIVGLSADLVESTQMHLFAEEFPERFFEVGIAEQNLASIASGMAAMGKTPFISSYAMFSPGRNWEQIRTTICYNDQPVKIIGSHAGCVTGPDGGTRQAFEDIAITRVIPNLVVINPCDFFEAYRATIAISKTKEPTYMRLSRHDSPIVTTGDTHFEIGKGYVVFDNTDDGEIDELIFGTGHVLYQALVAGKKLADEGKKIVVVNIHTIKPLDEQLIVEQAERAKRVVTVEDHQIIGGLGGAVAELLSEKCPRKLLRIGIENVFGESGEPEELIKYFGLDAESIYKKIVGDKNSK